MPADKLKYYKELDGLRGLAALTIFFFHFFHGQAVNGVVPNAMMKLISFGPTMANLFFVLSGFLITQILLAAKGTDNYFSYYYARRILRIFPLYYLALLIYFFGLPLLYNRPVPSFSLQWYNWFHLQNLPLTFKWPHTGPKYLWSLAVEEHFYLVWPMLVLWLNKKQLMGCCCIFFAGALVTRILLAGKGLPVFYFTFCTIDALAIGAIAGILHHWGDLRLYKKPLTILAVATGIPAITLWLAFFGTRNMVFNTCMPVIMNIFYASALCLLIISGNKNIYKKLLTTKTLVFTGTISYGFFIFHPLCISFSHRILHGMPEILQLITALTSSILIATTSYYLFEKKFMKLKRYF